MDPQQILKANSTSYPVITHQGRHQGRLTRVCGLSTGSGLEDHEENKEGKSYTRGGYDLVYLYVVQQ